MAQVTTATQTAIANLYISILGRNPEPAGFGYWCDTLANNGNTQSAINSIAVGFSNSPEFTATYGGQTTAGAIGLMYTNVLNRTADAGGLAYWTGVANAYIANGYKVAEAYALTGNQIITAAAANTGTADATLIAGKQTTAITSGTSAPTTTYTLTTGVDTFVGGTGNDVFNGTLNSASTLNSFDSLTGGSGTDTLNIAATGLATAFAVPAAVTFNGMEVVNISNAGTGAGTNAVAVTNTTFGTGVTALNWTEGGAGTTDTVSVVLNSANTVSVVSKGVAFTTVAITDTAAAAATAGNTLKTVTIEKATGAATLWGNQISTVSLNAVGGLTTVNAAAGTRALTVNASGTTTLGGLTDATATSVTVNVAGIQDIGTVTVAKAATVTINTTAAATTALVAATATTLNLTGTQLNTLTAGAGNAAMTSVVISGAGGVAADLSGMALLATVDTSNSTAAAPATGASTGANTLTLGNGAAFIGGAGQDVVSVGATTKSIALGDGNDTAVISVTALGAGGTVDGGAGSNTVKLSNANAVTLTTAGATQTAFKAAVTNFSTLDVTTQTASTISLSGFGTFTGVKFVSATAAQVFSGATSGLTITDTYGAAGTSVTLNNLSSGTDVINMVLTGDLSTAARVFGALVAPGAETVNLTTLDTTASPTARQATLTLTDAEATTIKVAGNNGLTLTHTGTALQSFDSSGVTRGGVIHTSGALTTDVVVTGSSASTGGDTFNYSAALAKVTITETTGTNAITGSSTIASVLTGGSGIDTIVGGAGKDTLTAGAGATTNSLTGAANQDSIVLTGAQGVNTVIYGVASTTVGANGTNMDSITAFKTTIDKIQLTAGDNSATATTVAAGGLAGINLAAGSTLAAMNAVVTDANSVADLTAVWTRLAVDLDNTTNAFAASATGAGNIVAREVTFTNGAAAGTYLVINDVTAGFQAATDMVIKLVGNTAFAAGDLTVVA